MLAVTRFTVAEAQDEPFLARVRDALDALSGQPGFRRGTVGRAPDEPTSWVLVTEWEGVGPYRRALSAYDVKVRAHPLLAEGHHEPTAFEVRYAVVTGG